MVETRAHERLRPQRVILNSYDCQQWTGQLYSRSLSAYSTKFLGLPDQFNYGGWYHRAPIVLRSLQPDIASTGAQYTDNSEYFRSKYCPGEYSYNITLPGVGVTRAYSDVLFPDKREQHVLRGRLNPTYGNIQSPGSALPNPRNPTENFSLWQTDWGAYPNAHLEFVVFAPKGATPEVSVSEFPSGFISTWHLWKDTWTYGPYGLDHYWVAATNFNTAQVYGPGDIIPTEGTITDPFSGLWTEFDVRSINPNNAAFWECDLWRVSIFALDQIRGNLFDIKVSVYSPGTIVNGAHGCFEALVGNIKPVNDPNGPFPDVPSTFPGWRPSVCIYTPY